MGMNPHKENNTAKEEELFDPILTESSEQDDISTGTISGEIQPLSGNLVSGKWSCQLSGIDEDPETEKQVATFKTSFGRGAMFTQCRGRDNNQDAAGALEVNIDGSDMIYLFVADGVGGSGGGEVASEAVVHSMIDTLSNQDAFADAKYYAQEHMSGIARGLISDLRKDCREIQKKLDELDEELDQDEDNENLLKEYEYFKQRLLENEEETVRLQKMSTTFVASQISDRGEITCYYEGDSQLFVVRDKKIVFSTRPHTVLNDYMEYVDHIQRGKPESEIDLLAMHIIESDREAIIEKLKDNTFPLSFNEKLDLLFRAFLYSDEGKLSRGHSHILKNAVLTRLCNFRREYDSYEEPENALENFKLQDGDIIIQASDGLFPSAVILDDKIDLTRMISVEELAETVTKSDNPQEQVNNLCDLVDQKAGEFKGDNLTIVTFTYSEKKRWR